MVRPSFVSLSIELIVCVEPDQYAADVERDLLDAFTAGHRRDGRRGFFHPDHFSFGDPVRLSAIIAEAMRVRGVSLVEVRLGDEPPGRLERLDQPGVDHADEGEIPIGAAEVARLENDPDAPEHGRLVFRTRGGR